MKNVKQTFTSRKKTFLVNCFKEVAKNINIALLGMLIGKKSRRLQLVGASMTGHQVQEWVD